MEALLDEEPEPPGAAFGGEETVALEPTVQMGALGVRRDEAAAEALPRQAQPGDDVTMASAYFNLSERLAALLSATGAVAGRPVTAVVASAAANAWAGASGSSRHVVAGYARLLLPVLASGSVRVLEWHRPGWSFHCKGMWRLGPASAATLIGSGNLGLRSQRRDLEVSAVLTGSGPRFRAALSGELARLLVVAKPVARSDVERHAAALPRGWRLVLPAIKRFM